MLVITRFVIFCLGSLVLTQTAIAEDIAPGLWALSMEATVAADSGFQQAPIQSTQCLTKDDARDPSKALGQITAAGATGCSFTEKVYVGATLHFAMQCSGILELKTIGDVTFSATTIRGTFTTSSPIDGRPVEFKGTIVGRRLGDC